jgi:hypothetical protein
MKFRLDNDDFEMLMKHAYFHQINYVELANHLLSKAIRDLDKQEKFSLNKKQEQF